YSQYIELKAFAQFGSDLDEDTKSSLAQGERIVEVLKQGKNSPVKVEHQVIIIFAVTNKMLLDVPLNKIGEFKETLINYVESNYHEITKAIRETEEISEKNRELLIKAINEVKQKLLED
ncbi:MAG: F0F1 ATP synthase subunit alpha, partial [Oscillospiraceae bacterium]